MADSMFLSRKNLGRTTEYSMSLLITNGTIIDGTGAPPYRADLLIEYGRLTDIIPATTNYQLPITNYPSPIDASNLYVTPGFIDIHSHSDFTLVVDPRAVSSITQGVTLEVVGNCGHGCAPITTPSMFSGNIYGYRADYDLNWRSVADYLARLDASKPAVNVATLAPNGNLRLAVAGLVDRPSTPDELVQMKRLLEQGMEEGAFGYSTGLEYGPEQACTEDEIAELCRVAARYGGFYATHTRNRAGTAVETITEAIRASEAAQLPLQISHISVVSRLADNGRWAVEQALAQVDAARARGLDVMFDMHTRLFGTTNLSAALPPWALEGSTAEIAKRLRDAAIRRELKQYRSIITALARDDWQRIVLFDCGDDSPNRLYARKSIAELSESRGTEPLDTIYDILLNDVEHIHQQMIIAFAYREEDIRVAFEHPLCMVGSDATALATDGPLAGTAFHGAYTWAGWFFRHFVRDTKALTPQEAIRRITSLPASRLGLTERGVIRKGAYADFAIFDPTTFAECGTTFEPNQVAMGMKHVVVNGVVALRDGELTGERGGRVLRR
jgi:N-acyl-D-aspartate/D-glutamate deacylase